MIEAVKERTKPLGDSELWGRESDACLHTQVALYRVQTNNKERNIWRTAYLCVACRAEFDVIAPAPSQGAFVPSRAASHAMLDAREDTPRRRIEEWISARRARTMATESVSELLLAYHRDVVALTLDAMGFATHAAEVQRIWRAITKIAPVEVVNSITVEVLKSRTREDTEAQPEIADLMMSDFEKRTYGDWDHRIVEAFRRGHRAGSQCPSTTRKAR